MLKVFAPQIATPLVKEFPLGPFTIRCSDKQHYRLYTIYTKGDVLCSKQASYPSIFDCIDGLDKALAAGRITMADKVAIIKAAKRHAAETR